ncbi:hypothetical protein FKW77_009794 [Venturia effusa]|uniref:Nuclear pore complex component n=1 Tax=Venturia effusa TaxID=50376 RepID=A0A517L0A2_9PEZI|nr:hypothetical protein FKW77_009794 [Venturia effusa]
MATITASPSTPSQSAAPPAAPTPPTGKWKHPRLEEISQRKQAASFDAKKLRQVFFSTILLIATVAINSVLPRWIISTLTEYYILPLTIWPARGYLLLKLAVALTPLWTRGDDMSDIPLTPSQRQLLGLGPSSAPATPGSGGYITPPRFARSTPRSVSSTQAGVYGSSPFERSANGSPISGSPLAGKGSASPYGMSGFGSPISGSPLVRKAVEGRRSSFGGSGLRESMSRGDLLGLDESTSSAPGSPSSSSIAAGTRASGVHLNSKWLYQRGMGTPSGRPSFI